MEAHYEYLIRYLSDEFFIEMGQVPYPPYDNFLDRYPETSPLMKNPRNYDLIVPLLPTHWGVVEHDEYAPKTAVVMYEPGEGRWHHAKALAGATPLADSAEYGRKCHSVRFGIDTELFKPYPMIREDDLLHVGVIGTYINPRRQIIEGIKPLYDMPGIRWMFFPGNWVNNGGTPERIEALGGRQFLDRIVDGDKLWPGLPNIYNRLDVLVRIDHNYGVSFPTLEAAACGVPVIATYQGIDHLITEAGGGILLQPEEGGRWPVERSGELVEKLKNALEFMRDNPAKRKKMGKAARKEVETFWTWEKQIPAWRKFLREATK